MKKVRITVTLHGELAEKFENLAREVFGNSRVRRSQLLKICALAMVQSEGIVFKEAYSPAKQRAILSKAPTPQQPPSKDKPACEYHTPKNEIVDELKDPKLTVGKSWGALKFQELRAQLSGDESPFITK